MIFLLKNIVVSGALLPARRLASCDVFTSSLPPAKTGLQSTLDFSALQTWSSPIESLSLTDTPGFSVVASPAYSTSHPIASFTTTEGALIHFNAPDFTYEGLYEITLTVTFSSGAVCPYSFFNFEVLFSCDGVMFTPPSYSQTISYENGTGPLVKYYSGY